MRSPVPSSGFVDIPPRAADRVMAYLEAEFDRPDRKPGSRLPSERLLAKQLKVSTTTVRNAFRRLSKEGRIRTRVGSGTYLAKSNAPAQGGPLTIAVGMSVGHDRRLAAWTLGIYGGMLRAAAHAKKTITLPPLIESETWGEAETAELLRRRREVNGLLLFCKPPFSDRIRQAYEQDGKPVVDLNPAAETATVNFVSPDYHGASRAIGKAWRETGRHRIALLLNVPIGQTVSVSLRLSGLITGLAGAGGAVGCRLIVAGGGLDEDGFRATDQLLKTEDWVPDAVYCAGDYLALGAMAAFRQRGLRIPEDVSVIGGSGLDLAATPCPLLTRTQQPLGEIGSALIDMVSRRIDEGGKPLPGQFFPTPFIGGATTRPAENQLLGISQ